MFVTTETSASNTCKLKENLIANENEPNFNHKNSYIYSTTTQPRRLRCSGCEVKRCPARQGQATTSWIIIKVRLGHHKIEKKKKKLELFIFIYDKLVNKYQEDVGHLSLS